MGEIPALNHLDEMKPGRQRLFHVRRQVIDRTQIFPVGIGKGNHQSSVMKSSLMFLIQSYRWWAFLCGEIQKTLEHGIITALSFIMDAAILIGGSADKMAPTEGWTHHR